MPQLSKQDLKKRWADLWLTNQETETIILYNSGLTKEQLFMVDKVDNSIKTLNDFFRVSVWEPIQYVLKSSEFYGRNFYVDKDVLIPRIDSELLIDCIIDHGYSKKAYFYDVWTGSWILAITLTNELRGYSWITAIDVSNKALEISRKNARTHKVEKEINFIISNLLTEIDTTEIAWKEKIVIVANLPYIKNGDHENMSYSTVNFEPPLALYGWETGFELYKELIEQCLALWALWADIDLYIEIGFDQKKIAMDFLVEKQLDFEFFKDSATIERVIYIHGF